MAEIRWTAEAQQWLEDIFEYIAQDNPPAAARTIQAIYERAQDLTRSRSWVTDTRRHLGMFVSFFMSSIGSHVTVRRRPS
jgi:plasmid stabilization system protein ParE